MTEHPLSTWDAAYVLGALSPEDRHTYKQHLRSCPQCTRAVGEIAGLPGLLSKLSGDVNGRAVDDVLIDTNPPATLLPALLSSVQLERNRWRRATAAACVLAAACLVAVTVWAFGSTPSTSRPTPDGIAMTAVGEARMAANISLTDVAWGTKIEVHCSYPTSNGGSGDYAADPGSASYLLVLIDADQKEQQVASWRGIPGTSPTINAATDLASADIARIEIRQADGQPILTLVR